MHIKAGLLLHQHHLTRMHCHVLLDAQVWLPLVPSCTNSKHAHVLRSHHNAMPGQAEGRMCDAVVLGAD